MMHKWIAVMVSAFLAALCVVGAAEPGEAQVARDDRWIKLGARTLDRVSTSETVDVSGAATAIRAIRLEVKKGDVVATGIDVIYAGGRQHNEKRRIFLLEGERTKPIDPATVGRLVEKVRISYEVDKAAKSPVEIEIWGLHRAGDGATARSTPATGQIAAEPTAAAPLQANSGDPLPGGDVLFGVHRVGFGRDRDVIKAGPGVAQFAKLRFRVLGNDVHVNTITVVYADGATEQLAVDADIKRNTVTRWFDVKEDRLIRELQLSYRSRPSFKGQARIEVYGVYGRAWLTPEGPGRQFNQGWVLLGAQPAGFIGFDKDRIPVADNAGGFKRLRVIVRERAITLRELRVIYANGQNDIFVVGQRIEAGGSFGPVTFSATQPIREIVATYRSRYLDKAAALKGAAIVEIWARH